MRTALSVLVMLAGVALIYGAMWRGWRNRGLRQADVPPLHAVKSAASGAVSPVLREAEGRYWATTSAGAWMDRVVVHGLGVRSPCQLRLTAAGLEVLRGDLSFSVARADLLGARRDAGTAGKVVPPDGVLVVTWRHPGAGDPGQPQRTFDSGFRLAHAGEHDAWVTAVRDLTQEVPR